MCLLVTSVPPEECDHMMSVRRRGGDILTATRFLATPRIFRAGFKDGCANYVSQENLLANRLVATKSSSHDE